MTLFRPYLFQNLSQKQMAMKLAVFYRLLIVILFVLLAPVKSSFAGKNINLYNVIIPVMDESQATRSQAFTQGLDQVFIRIAGDSLIATKLELPAASAYVKQYSYQPVKKPAINADGEALNFQLAVQYNGSRVINYLRNNGFPIWGQLRARLVVWAVVRDGRRQYVLKNSDHSLIKTAIDKALLSRGVPVRWPTYDKSDKKKLSFADIRGGFREPLENVSVRYTNGPILSTSFRWNGHSWQTDWTLLFKNTEHRWHNKGKNYKPLIHQSIDQIVDTMGQVYAIRELKSDQGIEPIYIDVSGVDTISKYKRVSDYLGSMPVVKRLKIRQVDSTTVEFELDLRSRKEDALTLLNNDGQLLPVTTKPDKAVSALSAADQPPVEKAPSKMAPVLNATSVSKLSPAKQTVNPDETGSPPQDASPSQGASPSQDMDTNAGTITETGALAKPETRQIYYFRLPG